MRTRRIAAFASSVALHLAVVLVALRHTPPGMGPSLLPPAPPTITFFVPPVDDHTFPGLKPLEAIPDDAARVNARTASPITLDHFTFDVAKVADHAQVLFPFLTPGLSLDHLALVPERDKHESLGNPLVRPHTAKQRDDANRPLVLGEKARQEMVDKSWSRRDRWKVFQPIAALTDTHSADTGDLPALLQRYRQQDSLQPYDDTSIRDPRLWAELELAADHVNFIGFMRRYASLHASSKATTELLFLLDDLAQSSQKLLGTLMETDPVRDLARTRQESRTAYDLILELRRFYGVELTKRGLASDEAITAYYDAVRLRILVGIVNTTPGGYRANDARFLIGAIYWDEQRMDDALHWWRQLTVDPTDTHALTYTQIVSALHVVDGSPARDPERREAALKAQIKGILSHDYARWLMFSVDRLWQFGYRFDTY